MAGTGEMEWAADVTTVMLRNVPNRYTSEELVEEMGKEGFDGEYDFVYLPTDFATKRNRGYCFVNFRSPKLAYCFRQVFDQRQLTRYVSKKVLQATPAQTQGFEANVQNYMKQQASRVQNPYFKPVIFLPGQRPVLLSQSNVPAVLSLVRSLGNGDDADAEGATSDVATDDEEQAAAMETAVQKFLRSCGGGEPEVKGRRRRRGRGKRRGAADIAEEDGAPPPGGRAGPQGSCAIFAVEANADDGSDGGAAGANDGGSGASRAVAPASCNGGGAATCAATLLKRLLAAEREPERDQDRNAEKANG